MKNTWILVVLAIPSCINQPTEPLPTQFHGRIAFVAVREKGNGFIHSDVMVIDGEGTLVQLSSAEDCFSRRPTITRDGTKIAFSSCAQHYNNLFIYHTDGSGVRNITHDSAIEELPSWSPDGRILGFTSFRDGWRDLFLMNDETGEVEKVTQSDGSYWIGCWSADNATLFYYGSGAHAQVYSYDVQNRSRQQLTTGQGLTLFPAITPDGTLIAYQRDWKLHFLSLGSRQDVRVLSAPDSVWGEMQWSSRGDFLVFHAFANGRWDIFRIDRYGTGLLNLTRDSYPSYEQVISPDDAEIAYVANMYPFPKVYLMSSDGTNKRPLTGRAQEEFTPAWGM